MSKVEKSFFEYLGIPGIISMSALVASWLAVILLLQNLPFLGIASAIISFFLDCLDGYVARKTHQESEFGRQLDGMLDFFNYLVFPALLFWKYLHPNLIGIMVGFIILATGSFRLIRFNIEGFVVIKGQIYYAGIVVCHILLTTVLLFIAQQFYPKVISFISVPIMLVVCYLQTSRILVKKSGTYHFWLMMALIIFAVALGIQIWQK